VAEFFDAIVIGDGEEIIHEICDVAHQWKGAKAGKGDLLKSLAEKEGIYVPSVHPEGKKIRKRTLSDLDHAPFPISPIVPYMRVIHDRLNLEIARGCKRGCRFCRAGFVHRPYRERSLEALREIVHPSLKQTAMKRFPASPDAGDYSCIGSFLLTDESI
jgi:radical SAM superfamily enzyme YgiQ (UPF0313 family)